jgi:hypothetical protein
MIPILLLLVQKSPTFASGTCMGTLSHRSSNPTLVIHLQALADSSATLHLFIVSLSHLPLPGLRMPMQILSQLLQDFFFHRPLMAPSVSGRLKLGLAWSSIKGMMGQFGTYAGVHLVIILLPVAVTRQSVFGLKITYPIFA